jgi:hypothetical protein
MAASPHRQSNEHLKIPSRINADSAALQADVGLPGQRGDRESHFLRTGTAYGIGTILVDVIVRQDFVDHVSMRLGVRKGIL